MDGREIVDIGLAIVYDYLVRDGVKPARERRKYEPALLCHMVPV